MTDTDRESRSIYLDVRDTIGFLRSCVRSGQALDWQDVARIDAVLDRRRDEPLDIERLARALPIAFRKLIPRNTSGLNVEATTNRTVDLKWAIAIAAEYAHLREKSVPR